MSRLIYFRNWNGEKIDSKTFKYEDRDQPLVDFLNNQAEALTKGCVSTIKTIYDDETKFNEFVACRFIILDAKPHAQSFYEKLGFVVIEKAKKRENSIPMLFDLLI